MKGIFSYFKIPILLFLVQILLPSALKRILDANNLIITRESNACSLSQDSRIPFHLILQWIIRYLKYFSISILG